MRRVNIYEEYKRIIHDYLVVKHIYRRAGSMRFYICQFSLQSDLDNLGSGFARKFYLVKTYSQFNKKPSRFDIKNGDIVKCYYSRDTKHEAYELDRIVLRRKKETIYPHPCYREKPIQKPMLTLYK
ncbi:MAG TPA: hypothetical protein VFD33_06050 [Bacillota bacterium]|nr:hypothetical protein [Bacillota bacterium]